MLKQIKLTDAVNEYLTAMAVTKSPKTVSEARYKLQSLMYETDNVMFLSDFTPSIIEHYFMGKTGLAASTYNGSRSAFRRFFLWCAAKSYIPTTPDLMCLVEPRKETDREWLHIPAEDWEWLLDVAEELSPMHRFIIALGLYTQIRRSEMELLTAENIIYEYDEQGSRVPARFLLHIKKSKKIDEGFPICTEMAVELCRWLAHYRATSPENFTSGHNPHLVPSRITNKWVTHYRGGHAATHIDRMVKQVFVKAGYDNLTGEATHTLRRSGANAYYNQLLAEGQGTDALLIVKEMLHHSSIKTTERYLRMNREKELRDARLVGRPMFAKKEPTAEVGNIIPLRQLV